MLSYWYTADPNGKDTQRAFINLLRNTFSVENNKKYLQPLLLIGIYIILVLRLLNTFEWFHTGLRFLSRVNKNACHKINILRKPDKTDAELKKEESQDFENILNTCDIEEVQALLDKILLDCELKNEEMLDIEKILNTFGTDEVQPELDKVHAELKKEEMHDFERILNTCGTEEVRPELDRVHAELMKEVMHDIEKILNTCGTQEVQPELDKIDVELKEEIHDIKKMLYTCDTEKVQPELDKVDAKLKEEIHDIKKILNTSDTEEIQPELDKTHSELNEEEIYDIKKVLNAYDKERVQPELDKIDSELNKAEIHEIEKIFDDEITDDESISFEKPLCRKSSFTTQDLGLPSAKRNLNEQEYMQMTSEALLSYVKLFIDEFHAKSEDTDIALENNTKLEQINILDMAYDELNRTLNGIVFEKPTLNDFGISESHDLLNVDSDNAFDVVSSHQSQPSSADVTDLLIFSDTEINSEEVKPSNSDESVFESARIKTDEDIENNTPPVELYINE